MLKASKNRRRLNTRRFDRIGLRQANKKGYVYKSHRTTGKNIYDDNVRKERFTTILIITTIIIMIINK